MRHILYVHCGDPFHHPISVDRGQTKVTSELFRQRKLAKYPRGNDELRVCLLWAYENTNLNWK